MGLWADWKAEFGWSSPPEPAQPTPPDMPAVEPPSALPRYRDSLSEFTKGIIRRWFLLVPGVVFGSIDYIERGLETQVVIPAGVFYGASALCLFLAAAGTYHDLRRQLVETEMASRLVEAEAPLADRLDRLADHAEVSFARNSDDWNRGARISNEIAQEARRLFLLEAPELEERFVLPEAPPVLSEYTMADGTKYTSGAFIAAQIEQPMKNLPVIARLLREFATELREQGR